jgi:protein SCO1/2
MADTPQQLPRILWLCSGLLFGLLAIAYLLSLAEVKRLHRHQLPVLGVISNFTLTNQDGKTTTLENLTNHIWVADIIFSRCAGPCPRMTAQMKSVQDALTKESNVKFVTLTTDPDYDTPDVLKKYGERFGADFYRWMFLTGTKNEIGSLAANSLKLSAVPVKPAEQQNAADLFIHTTIFVLVDKQARLRGIFETGGEGIDWTNVVRPKLIADIKRLEREP